MLQLLQKRLELFANVRVIGILFLVTFLLAGAFQFRNNALIPPDERPAKTGLQLCPDRRDVDTLDGRNCGYTPTQAHEFLTKIGEDGRRLYALSEVTLDLVFPLIYTSLSMIFIFAYWKNRYLLLIPFAAGAFDLLENFSSVYMALSYQDGSISPLAYAASVFTVSKWAITVVSLLMIIAGMLFYVGRGIFGKKPAG